MILHTINKSPFSDSSLEDCLRLCSPGDAILLIENGVYATQQHRHSDLMIALHDRVDFFALQADLEARGLTTQHDFIDRIDDTGFVELCIKYPKVQSWF